MFWRFKNFNFHILTFLTFLQILTDDVKTVLWESERKSSELFKSKVDHRKHFQKWFWSYFEIKNECSESLKMAFFTFLTNLKPFARKVKQNVQNYLNPKLVVSSILGQNFCPFWVTKLKQFSGKAKQTILDYVGFK